MKCIKCMEEKPERLSGICADCSVASFSTLAPPIKGLKEVIPPMTAEALDESALRYEFPVNGLVNNALMLIDHSKDVAVQCLYIEAQRALEYAKARVIITLEDTREAANDLGIIVSIRKQLDSKRLAYLKPFKEHTDKTNADYKLLMAPVVEAEAITRQKILAHQREQDRIHAEQMRINQLRTAAAEAEAELSGTGEITESVGLVEVQPGAPKSIDTEMGTTGRRSNWKYRIINFALLPDEFKIPDTAMLNTIAKKYHDQKPVAGVEFYDEPTMTVYTGRK